MNKNKVLLREVSNQADIIAQGDYDAEVSARSDKDALGKALFDMTKTLREVGTIAQAVAVGDFSTQVEVKGKNDKLGAAINQMIVSLREGVEENRRQRWLKTGEAELSNHMRGELNFETLCKKKKRRHVSVQIPRCPGGSLLSL